MSAVPECPTRLISDAPSEIDEFGTDQRPGAHQRVADAIAELIKSETGGKAIGLEGGWGSGKSTIVNLLKKRLQPRDGFALIVFDAWAHQGDPLRRTFLENLIQHLLELGWIPQKKWKSKLDEISHCKKVTTTKTITELGLSGKMLALYFVLLPFSVALLNGGIEAGVSFDFRAGLELNWLFIAGLVLTALFPLVILLCYLRKGDAWPIVIHQPPTTTISIENLNPTSVEFEQRFNELMVAALSENNHIVLVLDNLDRVASSDALTILATLQTFLQHGGGCKVQRLERLWVVIPYDPSGLERLWEGQQGGVNEENNTDSVATSMLDKRFQVRFRVPPLVLSDWRSYFLKLLKIAFPGHSPSDFHSVYSIYYRLCRAGKELSPTPRDLKIIVNQIGAVHRQWGDEFPLHHVAYYAILLRQGRSTIEDLNSGQIPEPSVMRLLGEGVRDNLAAMWFNVPVELARQLRLKGLIVSALGKAEDEKLRKLKDVTEGFWEVFETIDFTEMVKDGQLLELTNTAYALQQRELLLTADRLVSNSITRDLCDAFKRVKTWPSFDTSMARGIGALFQLARETSPIDDVLQAISSAPIHDDEKTKYDRDKVFAWVDGLILLLKVIRDLDLEGPALSRGVQVPTGARGYIDACARLCVKDPEGKFWTTIRPKVNPEEIMNGLGSTVSSGGFGGTGLEAIRVLKAQDFEISWEDPVNQITNRLRQGSSLPGRELASMLAALWELRELNDKVGPTLLQIAQQGHLLSHLQYSRSNGEWKAVAWLLFWHLEELPAAPNPPEIGSSRAGYNYLNDLFRNPAGHTEVTRQFLGIIEESRKVELLFRVLEEASRSTPWIRVCLEELAQKPSAPLLFPPSLIMEQWRRIQEILEVDGFDDLIATLLKETGVAPYMADEFEDRQAGLHSAIVQAGGAKDASFRNWCLKALREFDEKRWKEELLQEGEFLELVIDILDNGYKIGLGTQFQDALTEHGILVIRDQSKPERLRDHWSLLPRALKHDYARKTFRRKLVDAAVEKKGQLPPVFFGVYGGEISDAQVLAETLGVVLHMFTPLLEKRHPKGIEWIANTLESHKNLLAACGPDDATQDFRDRVQLAIENDTGDEASPHIRRIGQCLGIQPTELHESNQ